MKVLIPILIGLLVVGCGKEQPTNTKESNNTPEKSAKKKVEKETPSKEDGKNSTSEKPTKELALRERVIGTYEVNYDDHTARYIFLEDGNYERYNISDNKKIDFNRDRDKWKIAGNEIHVQNSFGDENFYKIYRINSDGSMTEFAQFRHGERTDWPKTFQVTFKKIESEKETSSNGDYKNSTTAKSSRKPTAEEAKLVGIYEGRYRIALRKDMVFELFHMDDGEKEGEGTWIVKNGEVNAANESGTKILFLRIEANDSLTWVARENDGKREDRPKKNQYTFKKIK